MPVQSADVVRSALGWWVARLRECIPERLRGGTAQPGLVLEAEPGADGGVDELRVLRRGEAVGHVPAQGLRDAAPAWRGQAVLLRVPESMVLVRDIVLPLAAEQDVDGVLRYDMDRLTPFRAEQVVWRSAIARRDRAQGRLHVDLALLPRHLIRAVEEALAQAGARLDGVELGGAGLVRLAPVRAAPRRLQRLAWGACVALALAVVALPFIRQSLALGSVEARIDALQPGVGEVDRLRQQIFRNGAGGDAVAAERGRDGDTLELIAQLTGALPDDTSLTDLTIEDGHLRLSGLSGEAAKLIPLLAATPALHGPSFAAPVTRNDRLNVDLFTIQLDAAQGSAGGGGT